MKEKVYSSYENGVSTVIIKNAYGTFTGYSHLLEEDVPYESSLAGCRFAEMKANIKIFKYQIKELKKKIKVLKDFEKMLNCCNGYNEKSLEARKLRKQIYLYNEELKSLIERKHSLEEKLLLNIKTRDEIVQKRSKIIKKDNLN